MRSESLWISWLNDSVIQLLTHWMQDKWLLFMSEWFTNWNTDLLIGRLENLSHDRMIHWFKRWPFEWQRSETLFLKSWIIHWFKVWATEHKKSKSKSWPNDSLFQTLIHWGNWIESQSDQMIWWFKHCSVGWVRSESLSWLSDSMIQTVAYWKQEKWIMAKEWFTDSKIDPLNDRGVNIGNKQMIHRFSDWPTDCKQSKSKSWLNGMNHWIKNWSTKWERNEF